MSKSKTKSIVFSDKQIEMVDQLKDKFGVDSFGAAVKSCISFTHMKRFPDHLVGRIGTTDKRSPEDIAKQKMAVKEAEVKAREQIKIDEKRMICEGVLGGEVATASSGNLVCKWEVHNKEVSYPQQIPLMQVNTVLAENQWIPSKEAVLKTRVDLRKKYEKNN